PAFADRTADTRQSAGSRRRSEPRGPPEFARQSRCSRGPNLPPVRKSPHLRSVARGQTRGAAHGPQPAIPPVPTTSADRAATDTVQKAFAESVGGIRGRLRRTQFLPPLPAAGEGPGGERLSWLSSVF